MRYLPVVIISNFLFFSNPFNLFAKNIYEASFINSESVLILKNADIEIISPAKRQSIGSQYYNVSNIQQWCKRGVELGFNLNAVYKVTHDNRDTLFDSNYPKFVAKKIYPIIDNTCNLKEKSKYSDSINIDMYKKSEIIPWDTVTYTIHYGKNSSGINDIMYVESFGYGLIGAKNKISHNKYSELLNKMNNSKWLNKKDNVLFENELMVINPHSQNEAGFDNDIICSNPKFNIIFKISTDEKDEKLNFNYMSPVIFNILKNQCKTPAFAHLYFYPEGEHEYWDYSMYQYTKVAHPTPEQCKLEHAELMGKSDGNLKITKRIKEEREHPEMAWECKTGVFCEFPGGIYLNAIYNYDRKMIFKLDKKLHKILVSYARKFDTNTGLDMIGMSMARTIKKDTFLKAILNQYTYDYQRKSSQCLSPSALKKTFSYTTDTIRYENLYGMDMGSIGGDTVSATYLVNPDFYPLVLKVGTHLGGGVDKFAAKKLNLQGRYFILEGLSKMQDKYKCNSNEIITFEKNLLKLAKDFNIN